MTHEWGGGSVDGTVGATECAPGAEQVDGTTLRQQVPHGDGGGRGGGHVEAQPTCATKDSVVRVTRQASPDYGSPMTPRSGLRLIAAVVPLALLVPAAAHAEKVVLDDVVGDVVRGQGDMELESSVPAPEYAGVDVVRTTIAHGATRLRVSVRFRALRRDPFHLTVVRVKTPDGAFDLVAERLGGKPITTLGRGRRDVACRGLKTKVDLGADTMTVSLPTACLGGPGWVQVGVGSVAGDVVEGQPDEGAAYADDAIRVGEVRDRIALGPKVRRG